jgi:4-hydroxy-tetrahydrodipicolinate synthase
MVTPFDRDGEVNTDAAKRLARHLIEHGSDGVVVAGTTGEASTLSDTEKLRLLDAVLEEIGDDATVVAGSGSNDTAHSIDLTRRAGERGVHALLVVTPYYNKPSRRGLVEHFKAVAGATDKPVMIYNIPGRTVINLEPDLQAELAQIDNIVAVKQANADIEQARRIVEETGLALYAGDDPLLRPFAEIGGAGGVCVTSHVLGEQMKEMYEAARAGDGERARALDDGLQEAYSAVTSGVIVTNLKAALDLLGFDVGGCRLPLLEATDDERAAMQALLERRGLVAKAA